MNTNRKVLWWACVLLVAAAVGGLARAYARGSWPFRARAARTAGHAAPAEDDEGDPATAVKAIHPYRGDNLTVSVQQILSVEPLFQTNIVAQVEGRVRTVPKAEGDNVALGELLFDVEVPQLDAELLQKEALVSQRRAEVVQAERAYAVALANQEIAERTVEQRHADVKVANETVALRRLRLKRLQEVEGQGGIKNTMVAEELRDLNVAIHTAEAARVGICKAEAEVKEKKAAVAAALADIEQKQELVRVALRDRDLTRAELSFARVTAPFDGTIIARNVQPGFTVRNATAATAGPLLTLARKDIVTVVMRVPDNAAPFVAKGTEAVMQIDGLPGVVIRGKVTRCPPSIQNRDRTLRVEVDLFNGSRRRLATLTNRCVRTWLLPLGATDPLQAACLAAASRPLWSNDCRSVNDPFPTVFARDVNVSLVGGAFGDVAAERLLDAALGRATDRDGRLLLGATGYMRLNLQQFKDATLIPSQAVFTRGGRPYILTVEDGYTVLHPVHVQVTDGRTSKVQVIYQESDPLRNQAEGLRELEEYEIVLVGRQAEIGEGQPVDVTIDEDWWGPKKAK
jgi:multidrug resistance efflux pump